MKLQFNCAPSYTIIISHTNQARTKVVEGTGNTNIQIKKITFTTKVNVFST